ncbi:IclR family transcriptional regulator [Candidimonas humi]|nr:IclR family transcriptional regulator [Candidimonas humi]MBV6304210.1 IclR family transcriptional regulator [Candidimonas humi]
MPRYHSDAPIRSSAQEGGVAAVDRALLLLTAFQPQDRSLSLSELSQRTQIVNSTALRLLASLRHFGLVQRLDDGRYALGAEVVRLHAAYTAAFSQEDLVMPVLRKLVEQTRESASFHVIHGDNSRLCLYRVDSQQAVRDHANVGDLLPLDRGVGGRLLMAFDGAKGALYAQIRRDMVFSRVGDRTPELAGIAAPVFGAGGKLEGCISLSMPSSRFSQQHIEPVQAAARQVSVALGDTARWE